MNDDGLEDVSDAVALLWWLFRESPPLPEPFENCGWDETPDALSCAADGGPCE